MQQNTLHNVVFQAYSSVVSIDSQIFIKFLRFSSVIQIKVRISMALHCVSWCWLIDPMFSDGEAAIQIVISPKSVAGRLATYE